MIPILVDCTRSGSNQSLLNTYQIRGFPTLLFVGSDGRSLGRPANRDAASLIESMSQYGQAGPTSRSSLPSLAILVLILIAVPAGLGLFYFKVLAHRLADES